MISHSTAIKPGKYTDCSIHQFVLCSAVIIAIQNRQIFIQQALRLPRAIRLVPPLKRFFLKILGGGLKLLVVFLIVAVFLVWFAVVSMQIFGYLDTEEVCDRFGIDQFGNFFNVGLYLSYFLHIQCSVFFNLFMQALQSMFQLVMQEGWTELMGEIMCGRDNIWWLMNIYFIVLHLFGSLVLLNFFVAVILDNLDYDDNRKKEKLEKELKERKVENISWKLKVFQCCGPKIIRVPKHSSADHDAPDLIEADVRNFYNIETSEFPVKIDLPEQTPTNHNINCQHRTSEPPNLELLTEEDATTGVTTHESKFWQVHRILSYVKAFRQHNRESEATARPTFDLLKSEYQSGTGTGRLESSK